MKQIGSPFPLRNYSADRHSRQQMNWIAKGFLTRFVRKPYNARQARNEWPVASGKLLVIADRWLLPTGHSSDCITGTDCNEK